MRPVTGRSRERRAARAVGLGVVAALVVVADQVTKSLALAHLSAGPRHLIGPISLELAFNSGVAFSLGTGLSAPIIIVGVVLIVAVLAFARSVPSRLGTAALGLVLGGAIGNLSDRVFREHRSVVDFIHTSFWPTFNLADSAITVGCVLLVVVAWRHGGRKQAPRR